ncbi:MAG TPA: hypothetical protein VK206_10850 [Anaerolineales bacterium]|nr:hypothetical protein [Anaerolineales bacterium]
MTLFGGFRFPWLAVELGSSFQSQIFPVILALWGLPWRWAGLPNPAPSDAIEKRLACIYGIPWHRPPGQVWQSLLA